MPTEPCEVRGERLLTAVRLRKAITKIVCLFVWLRKERTNDLQRM